jgi:hypothetical protein
MISRMGLQACGMRLEARGFFLKMAELERMP